MPRWAKRQRCRRRAPQNLLALDEALEELARLDPRKSRVVELRYFGGLSLEETAEVLEVSPMTVRRDWRAAKAWLFRRVKDEGMNVIPLSNVQRPMSKVRYADLDDWTIGHWTLDKLYDS